MKEGDILNFPRTFGKERKPRELCRGGAVTVGPTGGPDPHYARKWGAGRSSFLQKVEVRRGGVGLVEGHGADAGMLAVVKAAARRRVVGGVHRVVPRAGKAHHPRLAGTHETPAAFQFF